MPSCARISSGCDVFAAGASLLMLAVPIRTSRNTHASPVSPMRTRCITLARESLRLAASAYPTWLSLRRNVTDEWNDVEFRDIVPRSEEHTSELQSLMRRPYPGFCLTKKQI